MERCSYRFARQSDMQMLRSELGEGAWSHLSRLMEFSCTKPERILLGFEEEALAGALALAAPVSSTFHLRSSACTAHSMGESKVFWVPVENLRRQKRGSES